MGVFASCGDAREYPWNPDWDQTQPDQDQEPEPEPEPEPELSVWDELDAAHKEGVNAV